MVKPTLLVLAAGMGSRYGSLTRFSGEENRLPGVLNQVQCILKFFIAGVYSKFHVR